jgi:hypothetical protein
MKPIASQMTEVDHLPGEEIEFSISDARWVMRSMADLYSNRELAVVREYSTNAFDSNVERAIAEGRDPEPIVVTLPSALNPYFTVQDFGIGMSESELKEIYTQFGNSTKRDSNDFNGMLGFGSKSAVAYTNTFTVTSVKDGRKTVGVVSRKEDYSIVLKVILKVDTIEPNGVTVQVPVHNHDAFSRVARDFYRFWKPNTVLINGQVPEWAVGEKIDTDLYYSAAETSYVVMGNVGYRIANPDALFPRGMNKISFVAYVPNGAVEFTPSREDLKYSDHTKKALHKVIDDFSQSVIDNAKKEIAAAKSHTEAYSAWTKWTRVLGSGHLPELTFNGDVLRDTFKISGYRYNRGQSRHNTYWIDTWSVSTMYNTLIVTDFVANLSSTHKTKAREWLNLKNMSAGYILFTQDKTVDSPWIDRSRVVQWEKLKNEVPKPVKPPRQQVAWGRKAGSFDTVSSTGFKSEQDVPHTKELFYVMTREFNEGNKDLGGVLKSFNMDHEVVIVPANRLDKFLRNYSHAKPIIPHLETKINYDGTSLISKDGLTYLSLNDTDKSILMKMDPNRIDDPEIVRLIGIAKVSEAQYLAEYNKNRNLAAVLRTTVKFKTHAYGGYWDKKFTPVQKNYPLINHGTFPKWAEQAYIYINAVYAARKAGKNV